MTDKDWLDRLFDTHDNPSRSEPAISADDSLRYVVVNENVLGVIREGYPDWVEILVSSGLKGGPDWKYGIVHIGSLTQVRPATLADFEAFRLSPKGHLRNAPNLVEQDTAESRRPSIRR